MKEIYPLKIIIPKDGSRMTAYLDSADTDYIVSMALIHKEKVLRDEEQATLHGEKYICSDIRKHYVRGE